GAKLPGSGMIPAGHALRASLALKLWSIERKSHVMALVADEGLALFCGLNAMPKKSFLSEYSSRITPQKVSRLLALWHDQVTEEALLTGDSLNLDFHSVPYFGEHPIVESHYLSKRSRRQPPAPALARPACRDRWPAAIGLARRHPRHLQPQASHPALLRTEGASAKAHLPPVLHQGPRPRRTHHPAHQRCQIHRQEYHR